MSSCIVVEDPGGDPEETRPGSYQEITFDDIMNEASIMSNAIIPATSVSGNTLDVFDVLVYKTNSDHYGKLTILGIDDSDNKALTIAATRYTATGAVLSETTNLTIGGTFRCDLEQMKEGGDESEFWWNRLSESDTEFTPWENAVFARYEF